MTEEASVSERWTAPLAALDILRRGRSRLTAPDDERTRLMVALYKHGRSPAALPIAIASERLEWIDDQLKDAEQLIDDREALKATVQALFSLIARVEQGASSAVPVQLGANFLQARADVLVQMLAGAEQDQKSFNRITLLRARHEAAFEAAFDEALHP